MRFDDDLTACADLVRRGDPERFLAAMAAPVAARRRTNRACPAAPASGCGYPRTGFVQGRLQGMSTLR